jgi:hypothetical protein
MLKKYADRVRPTTRLSSKPSITLTSISRQSRPNGLKMRSNIPPEKISGALGYRQFKVSQLSFLGYEGSYKK